MTYSRVAAILTVLLCLSAAGCASRPQGVLEPIAAAAKAPDASAVTMLVATSRQPSGNPATLFNGERSTTLSLTDITISIPPGRASGTVEWPRRLPPNAEREFAVTSVQQVPIADVGGWFKAHNATGHVLVFVHGFNNRYEDSVMRFAQFVHDSGANVTPVLFTWPSRARVFDYNYDRESVNFSRTAFERTLQALADNPKVTEITVMAHSMGTLLAMESLRQMAFIDGRVSPKIGNVILASPDLDVDVFGRQWNELGPDKPNFTIITSQDDRALAFSRFLSGNISRVGQIDPSAEPYKSKLEAAGMTVVDLTGLQTQDSLRHSKFAESPQIVQLLGAQIASGQPLTDSRVGLGDGLGVIVAGTVNTVGQVAAATVAAPISIAEGKDIAPPPRAQGTILDKPAE